jgi:hypothetical protein
MCLFLIIRRNHWLKKVLNVIRIYFCLEYIGNSFNITTNI